jgi:alpha-mannosidase
LPRVPLVISENIRLAALKWAEQGKALIVRLAEYRGRAGHAVVRPPEGVRRVQRTNLLERQGRALRYEHGVIELDVRAWEIATLRLDF